MNSFSSIKQLAGFFSHGFKTINNFLIKVWSVIERPTGSTTGTRSGHTNTTSGQTSITSGQTSTNGQTNGPTSTANGKTTTTSGETSTTSTSSVQ